MNPPARNSTPMKPLRGIKPHSVATRSATYIEPDRRQSMIAEAAYYHSERRGFEPGHELDDWLAAESQVDAALALGETPTLVGL
jgi:Protein of unknown function (DUF2934)